LDADWTGSTAKVPQVIEAEPECQIAENEGENAFFYHKTD